MEPLLLAWFSRLGRDLPWRRTRDPYAILVSEVMLQQTQAARVVPRFERWVDRWPTAEALAGASRADVIREWQGLGYNRRAVNLQRTAQAGATSPAALAGTVLGGAAIASQDAPRGRGGGMMMRADTNGDSTISRAEFTAQAEARFARMDKNGDGFITADEMGGRGGRGPGGGMMSADTDQDGKISRAEFMAQSAERFIKLDTNGDGRISGDEMKAMMERMREGGRMGGRRGMGGEAAGAMMPPPPPPPGAEGGPISGRHGHHGGGRLARLDTNQDGKISRDEMRADADKHFDKLDTNGDGFIDKAEMDAARAKMKDRMGKMRMGGDAPPAPPPPGQ